MTVKEVAAKIVDGVHFMSLWWKILSVIYEIFDWLDNSSYSSSSCTCMTDPKISFFFGMCCGTATTTINEEKICEHDNFLT